MNSALRTIGWAGLGAGLMYLFDPNVGRRRRARARDKATHYVNVASCAAGKVSRDLSNRWEGWQHEGLSAKSLKNLDILQSHWAPATRFLVSLGGGALSLYGLARGGVRGLAFTFCGGGLLAEALTNAALVHRETTPRGKHACTNHAIVPAESAPRTLEETTGVSDVPAGQPAAPAKDENPPDVVQGATVAQTPQVGKRW